MIKFAVLLVSIFSAATQVHAASTFSALAEAELKSGAQKAACDKFKKDFEVYESKEKVDDRMVLKSAKDVMKAIALLESFSVPDAIVKIQSKFFEIEKPDGDDVGDFVTLSSQRCQFPIYLGWSRTVVTAGNSKDAALIKKTHDGLKKWISGEAQKNEFLLSTMLSGSLLKTAAEAGVFNADAAAMQALVKLRGDMVSASDRSQEELKLLNGGNERAKNDVYNPAGMRKYLESERKVARDFNERLKAWVFPL